MINTQWVITAAVVFNIGTISYAFVSNGMNNALNIMLLVFDVSDEYKPIVRGALTSSQYIGALVGAIVASRLSRLHLGIQIADTCLFVGSLLQVFDNVWIFLIGRTIAGMGSGLQSVCVPLFIRQFAPTKLYSIMGGMLSTIFSFGYFITMIYGTFFQDTKDLLSSEVDPYFWRIYFITGGIPSLIRLVLIKTCYNFDTPTYYIKMNNDIKAIEVLQKIYKTDCDAMLELLKSQKQSKREFWKHPYLNQFRFGLFMMFLFQFSGFNAVVQYSTLIFEESSSEKVAQYLSLLMSLLKLILYGLTGLYVLDRFGRRNPILIGIGCMFIANMGIALFSALHYDWVIVGFIFLFTIGNFSSTGPIIPVYLPEVVPHEAIPYCYWTFWGYSIIILLLFPVLKEQFGMTSCFVFFALITFIGGLIFNQYGHETRNKTNSEIHELFQNKTNKVMDQSLL